jgi:hypothetical protein
VIHRDADPPFIASALEHIRAYNRSHGTTIRQANTEWLPSWNSPEPFEDSEIPTTYDWEPSGNDYRKTLSFRQTRWFYALNAAATLLDYLSYGGEFCLANFNNCVNTWGQNVVEACKEGAWISPAGRVFEFFRGENNAYPLETRLAAGDSPLFRAQACETVNGEINLYVVNKGRAEIALEIAPPPGYRPRHARVLHAAGPLVTNDLGHDNISLETLGAAPEMRIRGYSLTHVILAQG